MLTQKEEWFKLLEEDNVNSKKTKTLAICLRVPDVLPLGKTHWKMLYYNGDKDVLRVENVHQLKGATSRYFESFLQRPKLRLKCGNLKIMAC